MGIWPSTSDRPAVWSAWPCESTSRSMRRTPWRRRQAASGVGPASISTVGPWGSCSSAAAPSPTLSTVSVGRRRRRRAAPAPRPGRRASSANGRDEQATPPAPRRAAYSRTDCTGAMGEQRRRRRAPHPAAPRARKPSDEPLPAVDGKRGVAEPGGHGEQKAGEQTGHDVERRRQARPDEPHEHAEHAEEHDGPQHEAADDVRRHGHQRRLAEGRHGHRRRREAGGGGDGGRLAQPAGQRRRRACVSGRAQQQQAGDGRERELEADVEHAPRGCGVSMNAAGTSHRNQPSVGPRRKVGQQRDHARHAGAHDRRRRPGDHHVEDHRGDEDERAQVAAHTREGEHERAHAAQQHDVLARHREDVQQTAAAHVVDGAGRHGLLVAQNHGFEHLAHRRAQAATDVAAGGETQAVDETAQAAAPPDQAQRGQRRGEHDVLAAPLEVAPVVEGARLGHRQGFDLRRRQPQPRAFDQRPERGEGGRGRRAEIERERSALGDARGRRPR